VTALSGVTLRGAAPTPPVPRIALQLLFIVLTWWSGIRVAREHVQREQRRTGRAA
jgi:hypothetical protein